MAYHTHRNGNPTIRTSRQCQLQLQCIRHWTSIQRSICWDASLVDTKQYLQLLESSILLGFDSDKYVITMAGSRLGLRLTRCLVLFLWMQILSWQVQNDEDDWMAMAYFSELILVSIAPCAWNERFKQEEWRPTSWLDRLEEQRTILRSDLKAGTRYICQPLHRAQGLRQARLQDHEG